MKSDMTKSLFSRVALLLACLSLASCAIGLRVYTPPAGVATSNLSVVDMGGSGLSPKETMVALFEDANSCRGRSFIHGTTKQPPLSTEFVPIRSGEPVSVAVYFTREESPLRVSTCAAIFKFEPAAGLFYRAYFSVDGGRCGISLRSAKSSSMSASVDVPFQSMRPLKALDESSPFCAP